MSAIDEIFDQIPLSQLAAQLGVEPEVAEQATRQALPALLGGMGANAQDANGAASLSEALGQHSSSLLDGGVNLADVDTTDGEKIVHNVFGASEEQVVNKLAGVSGGGGGLDMGALVKKLLPILAPIVMAWLSKKLGGGRAEPAGARADGGTQPAEQDSGGLGDLLGGILGGADQGGTGGLGDLLGGLLGGGRR
ncbi:MAG: DUF937 domain-containing protein [Jiangellaceae bacterium]